MATPDSGAEVTVFGRQQFQQLAASGQKPACLGTYTLCLKLGESEVLDTIAVFDDVDGILLAGYTT